MTDTEETGYQVGPNDLAFPSISYEGIDSSGLTKREYFAAMAMQGYIQAYQAADVCGHGAEFRPIDEMNIVWSSIGLADALIEALNK